MFPKVIIIGMHDNHSLNMKSQICPYMLSDKKGRTFLCGISKTLSCKKALRLRAPT